MKVDFMMLHITHITPTYTFLQVLGSDTLLGMTDNYSLYVLKHPYRLVPGLTELP